MATLLEFLRDLSIDSTKMANFLRDPAACMEASGLDEVSRRVLFSGSATAMWKVLKGGVPSIPLPNSVPNQRDRTRGSLVIVGTGIRTLGQLTLDAIAHLRDSCVVHYLVADPIAEAVIKHLNTKSISLMRHYQEAKHRKDSYESMIEEVLSSVRDGKKVCAAFYGHPGVFGVIRLKRTWLRGVDRA